jgi:hypothetical protein
MGARAGEVYRLTGITQRNPLAAVAELSLVWVLAYIDAAYKPTV